MERLAPEKVSPAVAKQMSAYHRDVIDEVAGAVARSTVVVVGMATNPFVKRARKLLDDAGVRYTYLEYGGYLSKWKERLAIKLWSGFPTFPMVFIRGTLEGGFTELEKLRADGKLNDLKT